MLMGIDGVSMGKRILRDCRFRGRIIGVWSEGVW